jgi:homoserine dehydrogenase
MQTVRLALIGFGNVGQGLVQILYNKGDTYAENFGLRIFIVAITDLKYGSAYDPKGLDLSTLLKIISEHGNLSSLLSQGNHWDSLTMISQSNADVIVEISYTNFETGEPALSHIRAAIENQKHVITTNKGPIALKYQELTDLARARKVKLGVEGTVMSGTPVLNLGMKLLAGTEIRRIEGILNGTTNFILTKMGNGASYADALAEAQAKGYAEADPTGDVEGFDTAGKLVILSSTIMNTSLDIKQIDRVGITGITIKDIEQARQNGSTWKLVGMLEKQAQGVRASVKPLCLPQGHPLANVEGVTNAITFNTDLLGDITIIGPGAGRMETGYAIMCDLLGIYGLEFSQKVNQVVKPL